MFNRQLLRQFYLATLSAVAFFMPLSVWLLSFFIIAMLVVWIADGGFVRIAGLKKENLNILIFLCTYSVYLLWLINTADLKAGLSELRLKLPLMVFPVVIGLSEPLNKKEIKLVLSFFIAGVVMSTLAGLIAYSTVDSISYIDNPRKISPFISHIRLALMINFSIVCSAWYFVSDNTRKTRFLYLLSAVWLSVFLFFLLSLTGIIIFVLIIFISLFIVVRKSTNFILKASLALFVSVLFISSLFYFSGEISNFYKKGNAYDYPLKYRTLNGNPYLHFPERKDIENGNPVWIYINEDELRKEWNLRSEINFDSTDLRNQKLTYTLIRYLASMGLTKDSAGMSVLNEKDIRYIENGISNKLFTEGKPIKSKVYEIIWQIDYYRNGGNPSGHSVTQRIEFLRTGINLFTGNLIFGTGPGDLGKEMTAQYNKDKSKLDPEYRFLSHNQYLTFLESFGISGFIIICFSVLLPVIRSGIFKSFLFSMFFLIILLSMMGEDTLETHTGVSFFAYFYSLFIFGKEKNE